MKKIKLSILGFLLTSFVSAQITDTGGNVGIGIATPDSKLHIQGTPWTGIKIKDVTTTGGRGIQNYYLDGNNDGWTMYYGGHYSGQPLRLAPISDGTQGTVSFSILDNGNVGIGTNIPSQKLHVIGDILIGSGNITAVQSTGDAIIYVDNSGTSNSNDAIFFADVSGSTGGDSYNKWRIAGSYEWTAGVDNSDGDKFKISSGGHAYPGTGDKLTIQSNGNIGIGTTSPDAKLTVKGSIHTEEVKVDLNVPAPDYVFEENYELQSLEDTKKYITKNKHLPEIPSAKEMETNGIDLGDMNMRLLKKIEELTLYQIELLERIETLEKKVE